MASLSRSHEISIHLMLLLNGQNFFPSIMHGSISIHLMLLLNASQGSSPQGSKGFQYILCCY